MPRINFRVTEVNDLSADGSTNKRVILLARTGNHDGTGPDPNDPNPYPAHDKRPAEVDGRIELLVDTVTQEVQFPIGSLHTITFAGVPGKAPAGKPAGVK